MENASKALIFAASVLIAVMLFAFMFYMFRHFGNIAQNTYDLMDTEEVDAFNSQFLNYATTDSATISKTTTDGSIIVDSTVEYKKVFSNPSVYSGERYTKALIAASQNLNKVTDIVSAVNLAISINDENNNSYKYNTNLEVASSVEIIVDLGSNTFGFSSYGTNGNSHYRYLLIEPNSKVKANNIYGISTNYVLNSQTLENKYKTKYERATTLFNNITSNNVSTYKMLAELRDSKVINYDNKSYTIYKYYFEGSYEINETTGLIDSVKFKLIEDKNF
jgi:hypothetical protein